MAVSFVSGASHPRPYEFRVDFNPGTCDTVRVTVPADRLPGRDDAAVQGFLLVLLEGDKALPDRESWLSFFSKVLSDPEVLPLLAALRPLVFVCGADKDPGDGWSAVMAAGLEISKEVQHVSNPTHGLPAAAGDRPTFRSIAKDRVVTWVRTAFKRVSRVFCINMSPEEALAPAL